MLETLRRHGIHKFIFSSTAAVYGSPKVIPIPEEHVKEPVNAYGESKLIFEQILKWYAASYGWSVVVFRYFNACGGQRDWGERHDPETHIIPLLLQTASGRREYLKSTARTIPRTTVVAYGITCTYWISPRHTCLPCRKWSCRDFMLTNIGTGRSHSVKEVCQAAEKITRKCGPSTSCLKATR